MAALFLYEGEQGRVILPGNVSMDLFGVLVKFMKEVLLRWNCCSKVFGHMVR